MEETEEMRSAKRPRTIGAATDLPRWSDRGNNETERGRKPRSQPGVRKGEVHKMKEEGPEMWMMTSCREQEKEAEVEGGMMMTEATEIEVIEISLTSHGTEDGTEEGTHIEVILTGVVQGPQNNPQDVVLVLPQDVVLVFSQAFLPFRKPQGLALVQHCNR